MACVWRRVPVMARLILSRFGTLPNEAALFLFSQLFLIEFFAVATFGPDFRITFPAELIGSAPAIFESATRGADDLARLVTPHHKIQLAHRGHHTGQGTSQKVPKPT